MIRFQHSEYLYALLLLPAALLLFSAVKKWRKRVIKEAGDAALIEDITGGRKRKTRHSSAILLTALAAVIIGWSGPYLPSSAMRESTRGRDVLIALDVSKSMLARDVGPDRLTVARAFITALADRLPDDRIGLLLFAGRAYLQLPLTADRGALQTLLPTIRPEAVPTGGTALAEAIRMSTQAFPEGAPTGRVLVILSDGEDHGGGVQDAAAKAVEEASLTIHTVGIGSPEGATLFDPETSAPRITEDGTAVISKLDEDGLRRLAQQGGGTFFRLTSPEEESNKLARAIMQTEGTARKDGGAADAEHLFYFFLLPAFVLLLMETLRVAKPHTRGVAVLLMMLFAPGLCGAQEQQLRKGNEHYRAGRFREAGDEYSRALARDSANAMGRFNQGAALYQQKSYEAARGSMSAAAALARDGATRGAALYNVGNTFSAESKWKDAADAYRKALRARPADRDAQYNLSYALAKLRKQQEDQKNQQQQKSNKPQPQQPKNNSPQNSSQDEQERAQPKQAPGAMSEEGAERILSALREEEKRVRDREQAEKSATSSQPEKDW